MIGIFHHLVTLYKQTINLNISKMKRIVSHSPKTINKLNASQSRVLMPSAEIIQSHSLLLQPVCEPTL